MEKKEKGKKIRHMLVKILIILIALGIASYCATLGFLCVQEGKVPKEASELDFEQAADTTDPEFRVDAGWGHIKDCFVHPIFSSMSQYVAYSYEAGAGVDGSQALKIGSQLLIGQEKNDLLVTPKVSGAVV